MKQSPLEKITAQLVDKFPVYFGTRRFIAAFTGKLHLYAS
jgi:hypothetical protein